MKPLHLLCISLLFLTGCNSTRIEHGIPNFAEVKPGIWRGGQPTPAGWEYLKSIGVKRVVKLNTEQKGSDDQARREGIEVRYLPIGFAEQTFRKPNVSKLTAAIDAMEPGTYVHCQHGQDRTGLVVGAYRVQVEHWTKAAAYREMSQHGFHRSLRGLLRSWQDDVPQAVHTPAERPQDSLAAR